MITAEICRQVQDAGMRMAVKGENLVIGPRARLTPELKQLLVEHKSALLQFVAESRETMLALIDAAMKVCDSYGDGPAAQEQMRQDCLGTPDYLKPDLLNHVRRTRL